MLKYALAAALVLTAADAKTPAEVWKDGIKDANAVWATQKHAYLKINDAAYLHEGEFASLIGDPKKPATWHWAKGKAANAALIASFQKGKAVLTKGGKPVPEAALANGIDIAPDIDVTGGATQMAPGETGLRLWVFDQTNKAAKAFKGIDVFPYDPAYRVSAAFKPDPKFTPHVFRTSRGLDKQFFHAGDATFVLQGKTVTLPLYGDARKPADVKSLSSFYTDELTGKGAYHAGRYVDVELPAGKFPPATVTIDFNFAYNPNCARSNFFNCPFAVDFIPLAMKAGEKDPHAAAH
ncbi:DUF1684 domain-containing protein [Rhizomicrobium electricum]|jgi:uncharacterized protein (DUF1684 family)|uniref:DUF1684 domain-containing protein n=1 Tax=Rhizomicrobium electricum TaxID=480070 RepID=A0ABN1DZF9_9PROT|nr:DUF1684 domain-containing protein [Rhizomicrobium electricum]NIJ47228.1 uncharacterized protein (DUF1684 family) [Rhizomicrobium electricum]